MEVHACYLDFVGIGLVDKNVTDQRGRAIYSTAGRIPGFPYGPWNLPEVISEYHWV